MHLVKRLHVWQNPLDGFLHLTRHRHTGLSALDFQTCKQEDNVIEKRSEENIKETKNMYKDTKNQEKKNSFHSSLSLK